MAYYFWRKFTRESDMKSIKIWIINLRHIKMNKYKLHKYIVLYIIILLYRKFVFSSGSYFIKSLFEA